jgi:CheY-like chemotaxis protein
LSLILCIGSEPELLLLRTNLLEKSGYSAVSVSNPDYALAVFNSANFDGIVICHTISPGLRDSLVRQMLSRRRVPILVFCKPESSDDSLCLEVIGGHGAKADAFHDEVRGIFHMPLSSRQALLQSWKEIAVYMRRGVRTIQRWEELGMPIHRIGDGVRAPVFAFAGELDEWMQSQSGKPAVQC